MKATIVDALRLAIWDAIRHEDNADANTDRILKNVLAALARERGEPRDFIAHDHPAANSRIPLPGDVDWTFRFTLEDGAELRVKVGETGYRAFESMFIENRDADYQERDTLRAHVAALEARSDVEMLRVKACEHIADGDEGWEKLRNECPSTAAVARLRDLVGRLEKVVETARVALDFYWPVDEHGEVTRTPDKEEPHWGAKANALRKLLADLDATR